MKRFLRALVHRKKTGWRIVCTLLLLCLGIKVFAMLFEGRFIYFPEKYPGGIWEVSCPRLFIHSQQDDVVPYRFGRRLFEAASEPKQFYEVPGASHNETFLVGGEAYLEVLRRFVRSCEQAHARHPD